MYYVLKITQDKKKKSSYVKDRKYYGHDRYV